MKNIHSKKDLVKLAKQLGVRPDWHEPDEEGVDAKVFGNTFDNAGFWPKGSGSFLEKHVVIYKDKLPVAAINLATLLAFACGTYEGSDWPWVTDSIKTGYSQEETVKRIVQASKKLGWRVDVVEESGTAHVTINKGGQK